MKQALVFRTLCLLQVSPPADTVQQCTYLRTVHKNNHDSYLTGTDQSVHCL
jgi:hypothetical protein